MRVMMLHYRLWNVEALPPGPAGAQAEIGVLAVKEKLRIEAADLLQHAAAVKRRGSARKQDLLGNRKVFGRSAVPPLFTAAVARQQHAGGIETRFAEKAHL